MVQELSSSDDDEMIPDKNENSDVDDVGNTSEDSNSSWEVDPDTTVAVQEPAPVEGYHLPPELLPPVEGAVADPNSEDEDDHTGTWRPGDLESLVMALNHYRNRLKGKFLGSAGGKTRRDQAWQLVAGT